MSAGRLRDMKWLIGASLVGAVGCVAVLVLSLAFGGALPITAIPMLTSAAPAIVIVIVGWAKTADGSHYRTFRRFSPAVKRLILLFAAFTVLGMIALLAVVGHNLPERVGDQYVLVLNHGQDRKVLSESDYLAETAVITRSVAGLALILYSVSGLLNLVRTQYVVRGSRTTGGA